MTHLFGSTKVPEIASVPPPTIPEHVVADVATSEEDIAKLKEEEKKKLKKGREKRSTILTSSQGILTPANVKTKTLLGQ